MEEHSLRSNYFFTVIKLILFLFILCFLVKLTARLWGELRSQDAFNLDILVLSIISTFAFYTFISDLDGFYKKIQNFFFRAQYVSLFSPSLLVILSIGYFFVPKITNTSINKDIFIFVGGFSFCMHLIFIARQIKGSSFSSSVNYLFMFSILFILNLIILSLYLRIGFNIYTGKVILEGMKNGAILIQDVFTQALR
ncbi:MAG: hypothetical protein ABH872_01345 [Candidatus Omnitrophota bacterium]